MNDKQKGIFIAFEGIDGSGKSTQLCRLANKLRKYGLSTYETFEPTDSPIGSLIHQIMTGRIKANHETIAALFVADRIDHILNDTNGILKKIEDGIIVLSDRYYFSSYAYHSPHVDMDWVIKANSISSSILKPDINIFIDLSPEICVERLKTERMHLELYENLNSMKQVRILYFEAIERLKHEENIIIIDGHSSPEEVEKLIWNNISYLFRSYIKKIN